MKKPTATSIAAAVPLSKAAARPADPITACNVCGHESDSLSVWREHDEWDRPLSGTEILVFIGKDHSACIKAMEAHPRLYDEVSGDAGHFPRLCGPCEARKGLACAHPDLKTNGGPGLLVHVSDPMRGAIVCGSRGRIRIVKHAITCAGRTT